MKPSKVVKLIASILGVLLLIEANIVGINFFLFNLGDELSFIEFLAAIITVITGIALFCTIVIKTVGLFETLVKKADEEWEKTQKRKN